jgi:Tfp pilus assembly protein PilF
LNTGQALPRSRLANQTRWDRLGARYALCKAGVTKKTEAERRDATQWTAVEEAVELLHEERSREALINLRDVLRSDPKNAYAYFFLGVAFFATGEIAAARDAYAACLKLAPDHLGARVAMCHVLRILGDLRGAVQQGMTALSQAPGDPDSLYALGLAHHARGDDVAATRYLDAFLATKPEFEVAAQARELLAKMNGVEVVDPDDDDDAS